MSFSKKVMPKLMLTLQMEMQMPKLKLQIKMIFLTLKSINLSKKL
jgi:hypothetical protein